MIKYIYVIILIMSKTVSMKKSTLILLLATATLFVVTGCDKDETSNNIYNINDSVFVMKASMANLAEITLGQIAADSAEDASIAQFGAQMVSEHTAAQQQLQTIASSIGMSIGISLDQEHLQLRDSLLTMKGSSFDSLYIHRQVRDHENAINFFKHESGHGLQKDIKAYVYQELQHVTLHLQTAKILAQKF